MKFSKLVVAFIIISNSLFTAATLYVFLRTRAEPVTLIAAWFGFTTGELWLLSGIKKAEVKHQGQCADGEVKY